VQSRTSASRAARRARSPARWRSRRTTAGRAAAIACRAQRAGGGFTLTGRKPGVFDGATADEIAVVARGEDGLGVFLVPGRELKAEPRTLLDPTIALADLALDGVAVPAERVLLAPGPETERAVSRALEVATVALALDGRRLPPRLRADARARRCAASTIARSAPSRR
jgi:alkylation response protein AidB-like acyl-CoA dehydrogenase